MAHLADTHTNSDSALLVINSGESKRAVEEPDFDIDGYKEDRLLFINQGMTVVASKERDGSA